MRLVLDASVAIKFYIAESDSGSALQWLAGGTEFIASDLLLIETAQALLRHHREGRLSRSALDEAIGDLIDIVGTTHRAAELLPEAVDLAQRLVHRLHDWVYLALAIRSGCGLLTADEVLARKINLHGITPAPVLSSQSPP
jgi:predicted nucleic acid-binding protein